jgi:tungstate transport system ATP-binding protein
VSLARAFVLDPELLLLDEPFSALDPPTRAKLLDDLSRILGDHCTAVFVTHNLSEAAKLSHRIAVVVGGALRQVGTVSEIKMHPADKTVDAFLQELPHSQ